MNQRSRGTLSKAWILGLDGHSLSWLGFFEFPLPAAGQPKLPLTLRDPLVPPPGT
jgi:hypothetical protein